MVAYAIRTALHYPWVVLIVAAGLMGFGVWSFEQQSIDAYPDISAQMVQVTIPVEIAMRNVPRVDVIRSRTIFGLSVVQMIFEEGVENYWARQRVQEKLSNLKLPDGTESALGPLATAYGEIYRYQLAADA